MEQEIQYRLFERSRERPSAASFAAERLRERPTGWEKPWPACGARSVDAAADDWRGHDGGGRVRGTDADGE